MLVDIKTLPEPPKSPPVVASSPHSNGQQPSSNHIQHATTKTVKFAESMSIKTTTVIPTEIPEIKEKLGKNNLMYPSSLASSHPAHPLLKRYADHGCPVNCGPNWSKEQIITALQRGPHRSALSKKASASLLEETKEKVQNGFARVVKWKDIKDNVPPTLKISPVACIPHKSRSFRVILDLSFQLEFDMEKTPSVNDTTEKLAPAASMNQLGFVLKRIIHTMASHYNPKRPFFFSKLDIKDGFWRLTVNDRDAWNFCYALPNKSLNIDETEIVVPNCLQMGWCESPPFFCASSETARDIIDKLQKDSTPLAPHKFEHFMLPPKSPLPPCTTDDITTLIEVFVDDFIGITNTTNMSDLTHTSRSMLHGIHAIFPPKEQTPNNNNDAIAEKKLQKDDGRWDTQKEILGWLFDGKNFTIQLPPEKCQKIILQIKQILRHQTISLNNMQKILGRLQHASLGIPGATGLFSPLQQAMVGAPESITITPLIREALTEWRTLVKRLRDNPTCVLQLVQSDPQYISHSDAAKAGCGGVWTSTTNEFTPIVWQIPFDSSIQDSFKCEQNPNGTITINDLELLAMVFSLIVLEQVVPSLKYKHIGMFADNTSAVAWTHRMRTSKSLPAGRLLRFLGLRLHHIQASPLTTKYIPGDCNTMADAASRTFKDGAFYAANSNTLASFFNTNFPLPQRTSWTEWKLHTKLISQVISYVLGGTLTMGSLLRLPKHAKNTGKIGNHTANSANVIPCSKIQAPSKSASLSQHLQPKFELDSMVEERKSKLLQSQKQSQPSPRPLNWLDSPAQYIENQENTSPPLNDV